jgi:hypothetical protein
MDELVSLDSARIALTDLRYWAVRHPEYEFAHLPSTQGTLDRLTADASVYAYCGVSDVHPQFTAHDFFTTDEVELNDHNSQEALGYIRTLLAYNRFIDRSREVQLRDQTNPTVLEFNLDNTTAVSALRKGRVRCLEMSENLAPVAELMHSSGIQVNPRYLDKASMDASPCDDGSRATSKLWSWQLQRPVFDEMVQDLLGPEIMEGRDLIDMFATCSTSHGSSFVSWRPDHDALWTDAMSESWNPDQNFEIPPGSILYMFPPENMVLRVLHKIRTECVGVFVLLVMPFFRKLKPEIFESMLIGHPLIWAGGSALMTPPESREVNGNPDTLFTAIAGVLSTPDGLPADFPAQQRARRWARDGRTEENLWTLTGSVGCASSSAVAAVLRISASLT